jgi:hypothetical protein
LGECDVSVVFHSSSTFKLITALPYHIRLYGPAYWYSAGLQGWMIGGSNAGMGWEFLSSPPHPDRLWGPPSLLTNGYQGSFLWLKRPESEADHSHLVPRPRTRGAIAPPPPPIRLHGLVLS